MWNEPIGKETDWGGDASTNGLPVSGAMVQKFVKDTLNEKHGASYFDAPTNTMFYFASKDDLSTWLSTSDDSLIIDRAVMNFTGTMYQVKVQSEMPSKTLYFTTLADKAEITVSFASQKKGITDVSWQDMIEDYNVSVYIDKGSTGTFTPLVLDQFVMSGKTFTFDVKKALATGANRVRVVAVGSESADKAQGSEVFIVNLTSMYLAPSNFTWYKPFVEGESYALGGVNIGGNLPKVLKIKVSKEGYERLYEVNIGSNIYTTTAYVFNGLEFPEAGTGVYNVEMWLDANGLESDHLSYNIICVSAKDKFTAQLVAIGDPAKTVYNFSDNKLFEYCVYNGGTATATPHIKVAYMVNTNPTTIIDEDLVDVATASPLTYTASLEIEMEDESAALSLETYMTYGNEQMIVFPVDNSKSYPATTGAVFYLNPSSRNNAQENREKIVNSINGAEIDATFTRMAWTDGTDGWTTDDEGRKCLRLPAGCPMEMSYQPLASVSQKTIEFVYKVKNAADYDEPIISICSDVNDPQFRGIKITPKNILIHSRDLNVNDSLQDYNTTDEETLHILVTIIPNYKTNYGNLAQIYCNGDKVRSFSFETADRWDVQSNVKVGSEKADVFLYKMRVYDRGFESYDALKNYINSLPSTKAKEEAKVKIEAPLDDSYKLSYDECVKNGLNTMVIEILDQDQTVPSISHPSAKQCNLWVKINNPMDGELDEDFARFFNGEMIENQTIEGQGTTAMTYARWNFRWKLDETYNKRRITAKKNFASSMHSHKMGATRLFNDLHKKIVGANDVNGRVAVFQYPVYGFQKVLVEGTTDQYIYEPIGLYTIGPDKGDKKTFGFDNKAYKNTLVHLEGTDHTPKGVGFDYPYDELGYSGSAEALGAVNASGSVVAAWEVGAAGSYDPKDDPNEVKGLLDVEFAPAYNVVERNSTYILGVTETLTEINADIADWQARHDAEDRAFSDLEFFTDGVYDLYFYNTRTQKYEARGINMLTDLGLYASDVEGLSLEEKTELFKTKRRERFVALWETYWHKNDAIFHYAFILLLGATDNFKKNTYPYKFKAVSEGGKYRWRQDDLDTLFDINNQGLAAKIYSILVGDKTATGSGSIYRGDTSVFWSLIRECFGVEIKAMVHAIFDAMVELSPYGNNPLEKLVGCIRYYFWDKAQAYFPASAYSKDAEWTYEDTWAAGLYKEVNPLQQSLGGHKEAEIDWVTMRMLFCAMFFNYGPFGAVNDSFSDTSTGQIAYGGAGAKTYLITMACDGNPTILRGQSELVTFGKRVKAGETISLTVPNSSGADTRIYIQGVDWMEDIGDLSDLQVSADNPQLSVASKRLQRLKLGDEDASKVTTNVQALNFGDCPSMMVVDARNASSLTGTIDLSKMPRLMEAYFGGTGVKAVNVPNGSKIAVLELGEETTQISLMNLKFMDIEGFKYTSLPKLEYLRIENCSQLNPFGILRKLYYGVKAEDQTLTAVASNEGVVTVADGSIHSAEYHAVFNIPRGAKEVTIMSYPTSSGKYGHGFYDADGKFISAFITSSIGNSVSMTVTIPNGATVLKASETTKGKSLTATFSVFEASSQSEYLRDIRIIGFDVDGDASDVTMIANLANDVDKDGNPHIYNGIDAEGKPMDNSHPIIEGRLRVNGNIYEEDYEALKAVFSNLAMEFLGFYVSFKDPEVLRILLANIATDDGIGLTTEDVEKVTSIGTWFRANTLIETFNEFERFTGVKTLGSAGSTNNSQAAFYGCTALREITLPEELLNIYYYCFNGCTSLEKISIPESVKIIQNYAFTDVPAKMVLNLPNLTTLGVSFKGSGITRIESLGQITSISGVTNNAASAFALCLSLESANLPDTLKTLGQGVFYGCTALKDINLGALTSIGPSAFQECTSLEFDELNLPNLTTLGQNAFHSVKIKKLNLGALTTLPAATTSTQNFGDKSVLEEVVLSEGVTSIPDYCFRGYKCVISADLSNVLSIGGTAFYRANLADTEINLQSVQTLGGAAFAFSNITKVVSLGEVTEIASQANTGDWPSGRQPGVFAGCSSLTSVILPSTLKKIGINAFANCGSLTDMVLPDGLEVLDLYAVKGCPQLRVGYLPESITTIGADIFYENANMLDDVVLPNLTGTLSGAAFAKTNIKRVLDLGSIVETGVSTVYYPTGNGAGPFAGCVELELLILPPSLLKIQHGLAAGCTALKAIVCDALTPPSLSSTNAFNNTNNCPIYVPNDSVEAYKTATNWSTYASRIYPMSVYENGGAENLITFADPAVEAIVLANWDTNKSGYMSKNECAAVKDTGGAFQNKSEIISFNEFENFTGVELIGSTNYETEGTARFINCTNLESIRLPKSLKTIKGYSFKGCSKLKTNSLPVSLTYIGNNAFIGCDLDGLIVDVPNLTTLGNGAFAQTNIVRVENVGSITVVGTSTGNHEFNGIFRACKELEFVRLPSTVTYLGVSTFYKCSALKEIVCEATTPPTLYATQVFEGTHTELAIYVPDEAVDTYKTATNWSQFASRIKPLSEYNG